ncbi:Peptidyl-tRNA hydrolase ICT1, mitochondrial [Vitis vinifera]|uniref:Peptidyl-tRNA hydrolase ICT1, mitochondrial n=1 Tax=Vitis vinifera TaxID=29760 RepID=A0A438K2X7_VITVI|nr:Peptidyl-tRNA hydrolase ICT1, mitochondrial [Vitis vinifera]
MQDKGRALLRCNYNWWLPMIPGNILTIDHVTVSFARSGGPGGQNVNKDSSYFLLRLISITGYSEHKGGHALQCGFQEKLICYEQEKNRINKDGEIVISSTKTRTQKLISAHFSFLGNIEDALGKLQAIIDAASYVPPPPSEEQKKKIAKLAAIGEQKRLQNKKVLSQKKAFRRSRDSWD